ncbi:MAG: hypothetical protein DMF98_11385 [Acidobacteria bacterium]|nr:MAG: hypothetical protein DMF98_11385 [Acidobacteriota bacterium]
MTGSARTALAIVEDARTRQPVLDVGVDDFVVQEDAESREILSVRAADYPVVLIIDTGGSSDDLPLVQKAAKRFVERLGSQRPIAIGTLSSPTLLAGFDAGRTEVFSKLDELAATSPADNSVQHTARLATGTLASAGSLFSSIVILVASAGDDIGHGAAVAEEPDATASVAASGAILYVVAMRPPRSNATKSEWSGEAALRALTEQSRGQFVTIYTAASYEAALDRIAERLASELLIEYLVPQQSRAKDVKVGVRLPGARVRGLGVAPR